MSRSGWPSGCWRMVRPGFWWCPDLGTAIRKKDGWWASRSGYDHVMVEPVVGPCRTRAQAIRRYEKTVLARWARQRKQWDKQQRRETSR